MRARQLTLDGLDLFIGNFEKDIIQMLDELQWTPDHFLKVCRNTKYNSWIIYEHRTTDNCIIPQFFNNSIKAWYQRLLFDCPVIVTADSSEVHFLLVYVYLIALSLNMCSSALYTISNIMFWRLNWHSKFYFSEFVRMLSIIFLYEWGSIKDIVFIFHKEVQAFQHS